MPIAIEAWTDSPLVRNHETKLNNTKANNN